MSEHTGNPNATSPTSVKLAEVIDRHVEVFNADELSVLNGAVVELQHYEELLSTPEEPTEAPVNVDVPYVSQAGDTLNCTMGNWQNEPDQYEYQWQLDGVDVGTGTANYVVTADDIGSVAICVVTAANALGSTVAPPSNAVVVAGP